MIGLFQTILHEVTNFLAAGIRQIEILSLGSLIGWVLVTDLLYRVWSRPRGESFWSCPSLRRIYAHRSARQDYLYTPLRTIFVVLLIEPFLLSELVLGRAGAHWMTTWFGVGPQGAPSISTGIAFAILGLLLFDIGHTLSHYAQHRLPFLWEFHKVHHSAEVLTPITAYRTHPIEAIVDNLFQVPLQTIGLSLFYYLYGSDAVLPAFVFGQTLYILSVILGHLRHTHVWISFGPSLERIFASPAQHQIHHSRAPRHVDKNFSQFFSFLDGMLGTLYVPQSEEALEFGLTEGVDPELRSPWSFFWTPVKRAFTTQGHRSNSPGTLLDCSNCDARSLQENR